MHWSSIGILTRPLMLYLRASHLGSERPFHPLYRRGYCLKQMGRLDEAIEALDRSLQLDAFQPRSYHTRGSVNYELQRYAEAASDWQRAYELAPERTYFLPRLLECQLRSKKHSAAVELLKTLRGEVAEKAGLLSSELVKQIANSPHAELKAELQRLIDEVAATFREQKDYLGLAMFYERRGLVTDASDVLREFEWHQGEDPRAESEEQTEMAAEVAARVAERLRDDGQHNEAIRWFRQAVALQPDQAKYRIRLGMTLRWWGPAPEKHEAEAIDLFRSAVDLDPENFAAHDQLSRSLAAAQDPGPSKCGTSDFPR